MSRPYTAEECRDLFLARVRAIVDYWHNDVQTPGVREKLEGVAFSLLVALDGKDGLLPGFIVKPNPDPSDRQYYIDNDENWWPDDVDIAGELHDHFYKPRAGQATT
jgi:hypothetical protein